MPPPPKIRGIYRTDPRARAAYAETAGIYRILPSAVCLPADAADLVSLIRWATEHRVALVPRGAGSAMGGGNVGEGVIVDLARMAGRRLEVDAEARRAVTGAGVTHGGLNAAAGPHGLRLPPDPSSSHWATLGGMVSTNAAGARSVRYGSVRRWVDGLTLITTDGETAPLRRGKPLPGDSTPLALARFDRDSAPAIAAAAPLVAARFPQTRKNSSGYALDAYLASGDILDLIVGAEGTLGIVTEIEWRLDPTPPFRAGLRVTLRSLDDLSQAIATLASFRPSAVELLDRSFLDLVGPAALAAAGLDRTDAAALLLVELEGSDADSLRQALEGATAQLRPLVLSVETAFSARAADQLWAIRHAASPILARLPEDRRSLQVIEDACVPIGRMSEYIRAVRLAAAAQDIPVVVFGHAGDGHIHVNLLPEIARPGWEAGITRLLDEVTETVVRLGGTPSGEHGDGRLRAEAVERVYGPQVVELFRRVKHSFDPLGILNPGIILPAGEPPIGRLKVGPGAVALPPDVEHSLREIERTAGYGRSRLELADEMRSRV